MTTYTDIAYHIVFATKRRVPVLRKERRDDLYRFIWGIIKERSSHLYRVGGVEDHDHILTSLHPTIALADFVKEIKTTSSVWMKREHAFPGYDHWHDGYAAFTVAAKDRSGVIDYIINQEAHHGRVGFVDELKAMVEEAHLEWRSEYLP